MAVFTVQQLVDRARVYLADDHNETPGWLTVIAWLNIVKTEFSILYRKWLRQGFVRVAPTDTSFTGAYSKSLTGVLAVVGVAEDMTNFMRLLQPIQSARGAYPFWVASGEAGLGKSTTWAVSGAADDLVVELNPRDTGSTYVVRWIPVPALPTAMTSTLDLPFGTDERLVLGIARRALLKESGSSPLLERLIVEQDGELAFAASGKVDADGPRVRRVRHRTFRYRWPNQFPTDANLWLWT